MARPARPLSVRRDLVRTLISVPLYAVVLSAALGVLTGSPIAMWRGFFLPTALCTAMATFAVFVLRHTVQERLLARFSGDPRAGWLLAGIYVVTSLVATALGVVVLKFTLVPGILSSAREAFQMLAYALMLGTLTTGAALSYSYYRGAVQRAGSDRELQLARLIQRSFLLSEFPHRGRLDVHAENLSSREVSGDFYDAVPSGEHELLVAIADVSGKGVPAALLSSMLQASLRTQAGSGVSPAAMMSVVNRIACDRGATGQFATFFLAAVDEPSLVLRYTNAGHNHPVLLRTGATRALLEEGGPVVGMREGSTYAEGHLTLRPGDRLVLYTDGVTEAARGDGAMFGEERLYALLDALPPDLAARAIVDRVIRAVREFLAGEEAGDDITVMALRVLEREGADGA